MERLRELLQADDPDESSPAQASHASHGHSHDATDDLSSGEDEDPGGSQPPPSALPQFIKRPEETIAIDDAENPLQLLARASYIQPSPDSRHGQSPQQVRVPTGRTPGKEEEEMETQDFFAPTSVNLDVGPEIDPLTMGLVTDDEAESLFSL